MSGKRAARLGTINDLSIFIARLINRLDRDEIEESRAGKLGYLCNILKSTLEIDALETRVDALEKSIAGSNQDVTYSFDSDLIGGLTLSNEQQAN
jgi:hypothetical protein